MPIITGIEAINEKKICYIKHNFLSFSPLFGYGNDITANPYQNVKLKPKSL